MLKIYYWNIRGLVEHLVTLCEYLGVSYELIKLSEIQKWHTEKMSKIESGFDFPNLPYIEDEKVKISQTVAIMDYITSKYDTKKKLAQPPSYEFLYIFGALNDLKNMVTMPCYRKKNLEDLKSIFDLKIHSGRQINLALMGFIQKVGNAKFIFGDLPCSIDFFFAEFMEMLLVMWEELKVESDKEQVKFIRGYLNNFLAIEEVKKYRESDKFVARPFNNTMALWK